MLKATNERKRHEFIERQANNGRWREEVVPAETAGLTRDLTVFRANRAQKFIVHTYHGDKATFCPPLWWDLPIGSGACGLGCRACFLMLTFRSMRDVLSPVLYENVERFWEASRRWLSDSTRKPVHTLGLGIDHCDSLLYEGVTGHARALIPLFADPETNPKGNYLVLLTKSRNTHYLDGLPTAKTAVTFSLNPESIADLWEGKWPDTLGRITPTIHERLLACKHAQELGFETRWRLDPILYPDRWEDAYRDFLAEASAMGLRPRYITLGTFREKNTSLDRWREKGGLPPMEWTPPALEKDGTHYRVPEAMRIAVYRTVADLCQRFFPHSRVSLCKETHSVRKALALCNADCNCLT